MTRPTWQKGTREMVYHAQGGQCAWCDKPLNRVYEVHHDYKGEKWAQINERIESDAMKALGIEGDVAKRVRREMYHDDRALFAMHKECHREADKAQADGQAKRERIGRA